MDRRQDDFVLHKNCILHNSLNQCSSYDNQHEVLSFSKATIDDGSVESSCSSTQPSSSSTWLPSSLSSRFDSLADAVIETIALTTKQSSVNITIAANSATSASSSCCSIPNCRASSSVPYSPSSLFFFAHHGYSVLTTYLYITIMLTSSLMVSAEQTSSLMHHLQHQHQSSHGQACTRENTICSENSATICRNGTCVSACSLRGMQECQCDVEEDNYCYLCCGNANHQCLAAHHHNILRPNGERWEREACSRCRMHGAELEGLPCDDTDSARLCIAGKCSNSVCHTKQPGSYCDRKLEKLCVDNTCENPCARFASHLMVCDCPAIDQDTGFASEDRCQLCCYDFNLKPANRRCQNAYRKYKIMDQFQKPIFRVGIDCAGGKTCNKYGVCSATSINPLSIGFLLLAIFYIWYI